MTAAFINLSGADLSKSPIENERRYLKLLSGGRRKPWSGGHGWRGLGFESRHCILDGRREPSGQSYKHFKLVSGDSMVVLSRKLPT